MDSETHYIAYDPKEIFRQMQYAYVNAGGSVIYPGDEKDMLLRAVEAVIVQALAEADNALRMTTLRYAADDYLDLYGEKRNCYRLLATRAEAEIEIQFLNSGDTTTIPAGTAVTVDGQKIYTLADSITPTGVEKRVRVTIRAAEEGPGGNGLAEGQELQFLNNQAGVGQIICTKAASGGQSKESDESYRERIRAHGLTSTTTGAQTMYEARAKEVSTEIIDARAINNGAGNVKIVLLVENDDNAENILNATQVVLSDPATRPLTDRVAVTLAEKKAYTLKMRYRADQNIAEAIAQAVADYKKWQDCTIGRAFNPDRLMAAAYNAGATRVMWGGGSNFDGGTVAYTEIDQTERCYGSITTEVIT